MPDRKSETLVIEIEGELPVYRYRDLLSAIDHAYNYLFVGTVLLEEARGSEYIAGFFAEEKRQFGRLVPATDRLIFEGAEFHSPGFISLKGSGEILKQIRLYFQDLHKRRQDREIREPAERRKLELQNEMKETELARKRIELAREAGLSEDDIQLIVKRMFNVPLGKLDEFQNQGMIGDARIATLSLPPGERGDQPTSDAEDIPEGNHSKEPE